MDFLGLTKYIIMLFAPKNVLLLFQTLKKNFSSLMALIKTSHTGLNKSGEKRHCCLFPNPKGNVFSLLPLSMILPVVVFIDALYHIVEI